MASVGDHLRELRQRRGLSLDEMSRATRVASRYLEALESDRFAALPAPVFTRGFILAYCQALGESPDEALARYDGREGVSAAAPRPPAVPVARQAVAESEPRSRSAVLVSFVLLVILGMALFAVALMTQPAREERVDRGTPPVAEVPVAAPAPSPATASADPAPPSAPAGPSAARAPAIATSPPAPSATPVPAGAVITPEPPRPAATPPSWLPGVQAATGGLGSPYRLIARASEATWIRIRTEDGQNSEETVPAGQTREWVSNRPFVVTLGNAGGVTLELNGRTLPPLGSSGTVISRIVLPPQ
jgi:cytoskeleton protein RodZ